MSVANTATTKPRKTCTVLLNLLAGNPVRAFFSCIVLFWLPLALLVMNLRG